MDLSFKNCGFQIDYRAFISSQTPGTSLEDCSGEDGLIHVQKRAPPRFVACRPYSFAIPQVNANKLFPSSPVFTVPLRPIGSTSVLHSSRKVRSSAWLAMKRWPLDFNLPTTWPRRGVPSRLNSTVYVYEKRSALRAPSGSRFRNGNSPRL